MLVCLGLNNLTASPRQPRQCAIYVFYIYFTSTCFCTGCNTFYYLIHAILFISWKMNLEVCSIFLVCHCTFCPLLWYYRFLIFNLWGKVSVFVSYFVFDLNMKTHSTVFDMHFLNFASDMLVFSYVPGAWFSRTRWQFPGW